MHLSKRVCLMHLEDKEHLKGTSVALQDPHQNALTVGLCCLKSLAVFPASHISTETTEGNDIHQSFVMSLAPFKRARLDRKPAGDFGQCSPVRLELLFIFNNGSDASRLL